MTQEHDSAAGMVEELIFHVEQVCGPLNRENLVVEGDSDYDVLARNFRGILSAHRIAAEARGMERAAGIAESELLPVDIGGSLILDTLTANTIAQAIRAQAGEAS